MIIKLLLDYWPLIGNIVTLLTLLEFIFKILKWSITLSKTKPGIFDGVIKNNVLSKLKVKVLINTFRNCLPLILSLILLIYDTFSLSPIDKILIIRMAANVGIVFGNILFLIFVFKIRKSMDEAKDHATAMAIMFS